MATYTIDTEKLKAAGEKIKQDRPTEDDVRSDVKGFLAQYGVNIDDDLDTQIKERLAAADAGAVQAGTIHIDVL